MKPLYLPMLAQTAEPFDHADYEFAVKWDGVRALAAVEPRGWRLWGRTGTDYTARYPELAVLPCLPAGGGVDGGRVGVREGRGGSPGPFWRAPKRPPTPAGPGRHRAV